MYSIYNIGIDTTMLIWEILNEDRNYTKTHGSMDKDHVSTMPSAHLVAGTADRFYDLYRLGMRAAMADGVNQPKFEPESWVGRNNTLHPYTKHEADMLKHAYKATGLTWTDELHPNTENKSKEPTGTYTTSPTLNSDWKKKERRKHK